MAKINWIFTNQTTSNTFTTSVLSANYMYLRQSYKDYFAGSNLVITIKNQNNEAAGFSLNDRIYLNNLDSSSNNCWNQNYWVNEIEFNDYPGNTGLSTATIICQDWLARSARVLGGGISLPATTTCNQINYFASNSGFNGPLPADMFVGSNVGQSSVPAVVWTDSVVNKIQINQLTENADVQLKLATINLIPRGTQYVSNYKFGASTGTNTLAYQTFKRINAGQSLINYVETTSGLGTVTASNATSTTAYGEYAENVTTADANLTQQTGLAEWRANTQADPLATRFEFTLLDLANSTAVLDNWIYYFKNFGGYYYQLSYRVPGAVGDTTILVKIEGINISMTLSNTVYTVFASPFNYYAEFILDDSVFGVLGGGGIVYNQAEITYDESGWIYNDSNADDTASRLGW